MEIVIAQVGAEVTQAGAEVVQTIAFWPIADGVFGFLFSLVTTAALIFLVWRVTERLLSGFFGKNIGFYGALFATILIGVTGLKTASDFLAQTTKIPILNGILSGVSNTISACITPKHFSPFEFIIIVGLLLYVCYWMHTRFAPKHTIDDIKEKFDRTVDPDASPKPPYPV